METTNNIWIEIKLEMKRTKIFDDRFKKKFIFIIIIPFEIETDFYDIKKKK